MVEEALVVPNRKAVRMRVTPIGWLFLLRRLELLWACARMYVRKYDGTMTKNDGYCASRELESEHARKRKLDEL